MYPKNIPSYVGILLLGLAIGYVLSYTQRREGFLDVAEYSCNKCGKEQCGCRDSDRDRDRKNCPAIDWSKYVLKASVPPCPPQPDLSRYILKTECPTPPDMSRYILKSAVPACPPCISTCNKPCKIGECPPCPRPRCPVVTCPEPKACAPCAPVEPPRCPEPSVTCKAKYEPDAPWLVRPMLSSFGL
jgi:hypothetical protein